MFGRGRHALPPPFPVRGKSRLYVLCGILVVARVVLSSSDVPHHLFPNTSLSSILNPTQQTTAGTTAKSTEPVNLDPKTCLEVMNTTGLTQDGFFFIDPDGPYGAPGFQVSCHLAPSHADPGTTIVRTLNSNDVPISGNFSANVSYDDVTDLNSVRALVEVSGGCRQNVQYKCRNAPMWWGGIQQVAWVSWDGWTMQNWGGVPTGSQGCACSLQPIGCTGGGLCTCDLLKPVEQVHLLTDQGTITDKDKLPIAGLEFRYVHGMSAVYGNPQAQYTVGQLECFGTASPSTKAPTTITPTTSEATTAWRETTPGDHSTAGSASTEVPTTTAADATTTPDLQSTPETRTTVPSTSEVIPTTGPFSTSDATTAGITAITTAGTTAGTTSTVQTEEEATRSSAGVIRSAIENSLQKQLAGFQLAPGNTSTATLQNATEKILGTTSEILAAQDTVDVSTKMLVATIMEESMTKVALGLRADETLQLTVGDTKVEAASFSSSESLETYVFSVGGAAKTGHADGKDSEEEDEEEVTLKIASGSFADVKGPVKVLVIYQGAANTTSDKTAGLEENAGSNSEAVTSLNSGVLTCSLLAEGQPLDVALNFSLQHQLDSADEDGDKITQRVCSFWNPLLEKWSTKGCTTVTSETAASLKKTLCSCGHNTSFAVLLQVTERPYVPRPEQTDDSALSTLSTVLGALSVFCLGMTLILYAYLRLFKFLPIKVHTNLVGSLLVGQILFLAGNGATEDLVGCKIITVLLQFFFTAVFCWMLVEGGLLFQRATMVSRQPPKMLILMLIGWGVPFLLTLISFSIGFHKYGVYGICWLVVDHGQIWAFVSLVIVVILVNGVVVVFVMRAFLSLKVNMDKDNADRIRASFRAVIVLVPILGLAWIFGFLQSVSPVFRYLFVILNASQGIFVFICHGLMNLEVQRAVKRRRANKISHSSASTSEHSKPRSGCQKTKTTLTSDGSKKQDMM